MEQNKTVSTDEVSGRAGDCLGVYRLGGPQDIPTPGDVYIQARRNSITANSVICMNASLRVRELKKEADRMREIIRKTKEACGVSE